VQCFVVHPGASFSTHDVYLGVVAGLRANGAAVSTGRLDSILAWYQASIGRGVALGTFALELIAAADVRNQGGPGGFNLSAFASAPITRAILLQQPPPEWVIVVSGVAYNTGDVGILRRAGIKVALLLTESPYFADWECAIGRHYDAVFSHERRAPALYARLGLPGVRYLPHAYNPAVHTPHGPAEEPCDVRFVGSLFGERRALFDSVDWGGADVRLGGVDPDAPHAEAAASVIPNERAAALYRGARVNLNPHRTVRQHGSGLHIGADEAESLGPRAYELAGCGAFQLMDDGRPEARDLFGDALATYRTGDSADLSAQARYWLAHDAARRDMAAAQHAAIQGHDWHTRAAQLLEMMGDYAEPTIPAEVLRGLAVETGKTHELVRAGLEMA
jgi:spore maturation protein CgeB